MNSLAEEKKTQETLQDPKPIESERTTLFISTFSLPLVAVVVESLVPVAMEAPKPGGRWQNLGMPSS